MFWLAYYHDFSGFAIFETELAALRYAVVKHMEVAQILYGLDVKEALL